MDTVAAFFIGFVAAFIGAIATGGGLISIPGLMFLGAGPVSAIATSRLNLIAGGISAVLRFRKNNTVQWKYIPQLFIIALAAGVVGPRLLLDIDENLVQHLLGATFLIMLPILWIDRDLGTVSVVRSPRRKSVGYLALTLSMLYMTMFGGGAGIFLVYAFVYFFGMNVTEANATGLTIALVATLVSLVTYIHGGAIEWSLGIPLMLGGMFGGYLGAHMALKKGTKWVKVILSVVILISGVKLLLF
jgi:uncharacterized membrane protein YfcA